MNTRTFLYSLRTIDDKPTLCIDLMAKILSENSTSLELQLPNQLIKINKYEFLNKDRIFDNGTVFFYVCSKAVSREYIFRKLMNYAINKLEGRISHLQSLKQSYSKLIAA